MKNLKKSIAKKAAKVVLGTVRMSNGTASIFDTHQPKEPANLSARLANRK